MHERPTALELAKVPLTDRGIGWQADATAVLKEQAAEIAALREDLKTHKAHIRMGNDIITNQCIAMQAALLEQSIGKGDEAALEWISNTLCGPGLLPDDSEAAHLPDTPAKGPAQAWFDAKMAEHEAMRARQDAAVGAA